jgi:hypothetical protein
MIGDLYVSLSYKKFANSLKDEELKNYIVKWSNSIILNLLLSLKRNENPIVDKGFKEKVIKEMREHQCFPIKGPFFTIKSLILSKILNYSI